MSKFSCFATGREFRGIKASRRPAAPRQGSSGLGSALGLHCRAVRREERPKSQKQPPTDKQIPEAEPRKAIVPEGEVFQNSFPVQANPKTAQGKINLPPLPFPERANPLPPSSAYPDARSAGTLANRRKAAWPAGETLLPKQSPRRQAIPASP